MRILTAFIIIVAFSTVSLLIKSSGGAIITIENVRQEGDFLAIDVRVKNKTKASLQVDNLEAHFENELQTTSIGTLAPHQEVTHTFRRDLDLGTLSLYGIKSTGQTISVIVQAYEGTKCLGWEKTKVAL